MSFLKRLFGGQQPADFWQWVSANVDLIRAGDAAFVEREILPRFNKSFKELSLGVLLGDPTEFEIGAGGISEYIPKVIEAVQSAPAIPGIKVVAFRQPHQPQGGIRMGDTEVDLSATRVAVGGEHEGRVDIDLYVAVPPDTSMPIVMQLGFLALDHSLGEYRVMTQIGGIDFHTIDQAPHDAVTIQAFAASLPPSEY